jgi:hypothetical protein
MAAAATAANRFVLAGYFGTVLHSRQKTFDVNIAANVRGRKGATMPVIGRLDRQVDDLIISPVSKRRRGDDPASDEDEQTEAHTDESSAEADELPVWLL